MSRELTKNNLSGSSLENNCISLMVRQKSVDDNEIGALASNYDEGLRNFNLVPSQPFLSKYENHINNIIHYYEYFEISQLPIDNFFEINFYLFRFIKLNIKTFDSFTKDCIKKHETDRDRIFNLWKILQHFLVNHLKDEDYSVNNNITCTSSLNEDFEKLLMCLVNEDMANENGMELFNLKVIFEDKNKLLRTIHEFATTFIIFLFDMPAHVVHFEDENPFIELKIYLVEIQYDPYDTDIFYVFSHKFLTSSNIFNDSLNPKRMISIEEHQQGILAKSNIEEVNDEFSLISNNDGLKEHKNTSLENENLNISIESLSKTPNSLDLDEVLTTNFDEDELMELKKFPKYEVLSKEDNMNKSIESFSKTPKSLDLDEVLTTDFDESELLEFKKSPKHEVALKEDNINKYFSKIRSGLHLNSYEILRHIEIDKLTKPSNWMIILKLLLSTLSIVDTILDVWLAYKFFKSGQMIYGYLTVSILLTVGIVNIFLERQYVRKYKVDSNYLPDCCSYTILRYVCGFLQLSTFLSVLKFTVVSIRSRKDQQIQTLLKILTQSNTGMLQYVSQNLKYIETYLEALPQTLLQIHIILTTNEWVWLQLLSIASGIVNINLTGLTFEAMCKDLNFINFLRHPSLMLLPLSYNGFLITSQTMLFWQFHWIFGALWIGLHFFISFFCRWSKSDFHLIFMHHKFTNIKYFQFFNKITIIDIFISICILMIKLDQLEDPVFLVLFICQIAFSIICVGLIIWNDFYLSINLMQIPYFVRDAFS